MRRRRRESELLLRLALLALPAGCSGGALGHVETVPVQPPPAPPTAAPAAAPPASSATPEEPPPELREVGAGFAVDPREPAPSRREMAGKAALVWDVLPAKPNPSGPRDRDTTRTRFVVEKNGRAEVVAERGEAVMTGGGTLWHLVGSDLPVVVMDCAAGGKRVQHVHKQIVFESLGKKRRRVAPMEGAVKAGDWARMDLEAMVGPWVVATVDRVHEDDCEGHHLGSPERVVVDLDRGEERRFALPKGALARYGGLVRDVVGRGCGTDWGTIEEAGAGFHYDRGGDLVVELGFSSSTATACFGGIVHVFVGTYELLPELEPHGRLPGWLRGFLGERASRSVSVIPLGGEEAARKELERLPEVAPTLPRDSDP
jgi:hypothetical protein